MNQSQLEAIAGSLGWEKSWVIDLQSGSSFVNQSHNQVKQTQRKQQLLSPPHRKTTQIVIRWTSNFTVKGWGAIVWLQRSFVSFCVYVCFFLIDQQLTFFCSWLTSVFSFVWPGSLALKIRDLPLDDLLISGGVFAMSDGWDLKNAWELHTSLPPHDWPGYNVYPCVNKPWTPVYYLLPTCKFEVLHHWTAANLRHLFFGSRHWGQNGSTLGQRKASTRHIRHTKHQTVTATTTE